MKQASNLKQSSIFLGKKVYYSGSIKGSTEIDPEFAWKIVQYMSENGAKVLSEHVAARSKDEMNTLLLGNVGKEIQELLKGQEPWFGIRKQDLDWVDEATHVVALINAPSHGVGIELEHAILKPKLGLNKTPILCLVHKDLFDKVSFMIKGISIEESDVFYLKSYSDLESVKLLVKDFLLDKMEQNEEK